jgi:glycosyltransferase involved in cell wall biosynthesis
VTRVSVIVPVYNAPDDYVTTCVEALLRQDFPRESYEVVLVDDGSRKRPLKAQLKRLGLAHHRSLTFIETTHAGPAVARSIGLHAAQGELIAFTDIDCVPRTNWLARYADAFSDRPIDAAGGLTLSYAVDTWVEKYCDYFGSLRVPLVRGDVRLLIACNACWRASTLHSLGGFHHNYLAAANAGLTFKGFEDFELSVRAARQGCRIELVGDAIVAHRHRRGVYGRFKQFSSYGSGYAAFQRLCPDGPNGLTRYGIGTTAPFLDAARSMVRCVAELPARPFAREYDGLPPARRVAYPLLDELQRVAFYIGFCRAERRLRAIGDLLPAPAVYAPALPQSASYCPGRGVGW